MVGIVVTISPNFILYRMVVLPAASGKECNSSSNESWTRFFNVAHRLQLRSKGNTKHMNDNEHTESDHKNTDILLPEEPLEDARNCKTHVGRSAL